MQRRFTFKALAGALAIAAIPCAALAQGAANYPNKPVRMVIPWPAGGPSDLVGRELANRLSLALGQPFVIENRAGANGVPGAAIVAKAAPDGYTLMFHNLTSHATNPSIYKTLPYDTIKDFSAITTVVASSLMIAAHPSFAPKNMTEVISWAKDKPGSINFASFGLGSLGHLGIGQLTDMTGATFNHVPYKGGAPAVNDTLAGHTSLAIVGFANALQHLKTGGLKAIAMTGTTRSPQLPDLPTVAESPGLAGYDMGFKQALFAPGKTPVEVIRIINIAAAAIIASPEFKAKALSYGMDESKSSTPEEMSKIIVTDVERLGKMVKSLGLKPE